VANFDRTEAKTEATRSHATAIAGRDKMADVIGQALSAIMLGLTPGNGGKIAISELARRRLDGQQIVKERLAEPEIQFFPLPRGSGDALRTADNTPRMVLAPKDQARYRKLIARMQGAMGENFNSLLSERIDDQSIDLNCHLVKLRSQCRRMPPEAASRSSNNLWNYIYFLHYTLFDKALATPIYRQLAELATQQRVRIPVNFYIGSQNIYERICQNFAFNCHGNLNTVIACGLTPPRIRTSWNRAAKFIARG
jgi:hypothetical protein